MAVLIRGVEMPKECNKCPLRNINLHDVWYETCSAAKPFPKQVPYSGKPDWCPCEDVPTPHGRLVDINTILHDGNRGCVDELINDPELSEQIKVGVSAARVIICSAPTIIEAEE